MSYGTNTPLVLASDVQSLLAGSTADTAMTMIIGGVSDLARKYCNREFFIANYIESYQGSNNARLMMRQTPIQAVTNVTMACGNGNLIISACTLDPNGNPFPQTLGYFFDSKAINLGGGLRFPYSQIPNVYISYSAGYTATGTPQALPADLYEVLCYECAIRHKELNRMGEKSENLGGSSTTYSVLSLQAQTKDVLNRYRRVTGA
jgi:hypothetical protein